MQKSVLRILLISCCLMICGCAVYQPPNVNPIENTISEFPNPYFSDTSKDYVYKANMEIYGRNLGGIVVVKMINKDTHRAVFTTDFGNKLLDFELTKDSFVLNFAADGMDNKRLLKILENDFRYLLQTVFPLDQTFEGDKHLVYSSVQNKGELYLFKDKENNELQKMIFAQKSKERITFEFQNKKDKLATQIGIIHHNIPFRLQLNRL